MVKRDEQVRLAVFSNVWEPYINGVIISAQNFMQGFKKLGHELFVFCPRYKDFSENEEGWENIIRLNAFETLKGYSIPLGRYSIPIPFGNFDSVLDMLNLLRVNAVMTEHPAWFGTLALNVADSLKIPKLCSIHCQWEEYFIRNWHLPRFLARYASKRTFNKHAERCNRVIAPAQGIKDKLLEYKVKTPIEVVPNGLDFEEFMSGEKINVREKYKIRDKRIILYVGRVSNEKSIDELLFSIKEAKQVHNDICGVIVGDGPDMNRLKKLTKDNRLENDVIFTGRIPHNQLYNFYSEAYMFATASVTEVQPVTFLEAYYCGAPVIAKNAPGNYETIINKRTGILTHNSQLGFSIGLCWLLSDPYLRERLSKNAKQEVMKYDNSIVSQKLIDVIYSI
ncbi:glycosyltransferase [Candidatus Pacearchaeota archaeon]|nr:glycosyltransferase [Candidatus Pacearchaeota archaeon]